MEDPTGADIHIAARGGPCQGRYSYASPWRTLQEQISTQQPMEEHAEVDKHTAACGGPHTGAGGYALEEDALFLPYGKPMLE